MVFCKVICGRTRLGFDLSIFLFLFFIFTRYMYVSLSIRMYLHVCIYRYVRVGFQLHICLHFVFTCTLAVFLQDIWVRIRAGFLCSPKAGMPDAVRYLLGSNRVCNSLPGNWQDLLKVCIPLGNLAYIRGCRG